MWCGQHVVNAALMLVQHALFGRELEKKEKEEKERQKEERKRAERQHRDAFKALLDKHRAAGVLGPKMRWKVHCFFVREVFLIASGVHASWPDSPHHLQLHALLHGTCTFFMCLCSRQGCID